MPVAGLRKRFRAAPWGLLGMIVLVGIVEGVLSRHELDFLSPIHNQWRTQGRESRRQAVRAEILCLGDSLVAQGVIPAVLEDRLKRPVYNLGLGGGQFPTQYFLFRRALESGAKPSAVVIDVLPSQLRISGGDRVPLWSNILEHREAFEMAWVARDPEFLGSVLLAKHFTSIQSRYEIRQGILDMLGGSLRSTRETNLAGKRNLRLNQGALILPPFGHFQVDARHHRWVYPEVVTANRLNGEYMERFFELAESRKIPIFWLLTPVCPAIQAQGEQTGTFEAHARFVREVQRRHPSITVVDARRSAYPESALDDSIHLTHPAAAVFTADLADVMARTPQGGPAKPKWVELPRFRDRPIEYRHEDLAESRKAVSR